jgi:hypothetical protein
MKREDSPGGAQGPCANRSHLGAVLGAILGMALLACATVSQAALISYTTAPGANFAGQPVSAKATFTTSANQIVVLLENLQADPTAAVQCLSGLKFQVSTGESIGTLSSSSGTERTINDNSVGGYTVGALVSTGWGLSTSGSDLWLDRLSQPNASKYTIIGPPNGSNAYANGNPSINGGSHNPHLGLNATFTLIVPGVTGASSISAVTFQFNTAYGSEQTGDAPEPGSAVIAGLMLAALSSRRARR